VEEYFVHFQGSCARSWVARHCAVRRINTQGGDSNFQWTHAPLARRNHKRPFFPATSYLVF
jgi:hypothetical protein